MTPSKLHYIANLALREMMFCALSCLQALILMVIPHLFIVNASEYLFRNVGMITILIAPLELLNDIVLKRFWIVLFIPYLLWIIFRLLRLRYMKKVNTKKLVIYTSLLFLIISTLATPRLFDCNKNVFGATWHANGYFYKGKKDVCYRWATSPRGDHLSMRLPYADHASFEVLEYGYAKDKDTVYFDNGMPACDECVKYDFEITKVGSADPATFRVLNKKYTVDSKSVFCEGKKLELADVGSFKVIDKETAEDKNRSFKGCEMTPQVK